MESKIYHGNLTITAENVLEYKHINTVTGYLSIKESGTFLPALTEIGGALCIVAPDAQLPALTHVGGALFIHSRNASLPALASVGDDAYIRADGTSLPALAVVGGGLYISAHNARMPALAGIGGGNLFISSDGADLPMLTEVLGGLYIRTEGSEFDHSKIKFGAGEVLAVSGYALHLKDGMYSAGCRGPWTAEQALAHWGTDHPCQERASIFRRAIIGHE